VGLTGNVHSRLVGKYCVCGPLGAARHKLEDSNKISCCKCIEFPGVRNGVASDEKQGFIILGI
jgi:hypothetical protein